MKCNTFNRCSKEANTYITYDTKSDKKKKMHVCCSCKERLREYLPRSTIIYLKETRNN